MCLNETDKRMCLLTFSNSENTSVGCSVSVALSFCFRTGSRSWCWHVSWQPACDFSWPAGQKNWLVYWVLLMSWTHVTNKVVFMFDVCPLNCKPGMYDTARIRDWLHSNDLSDWILIRIWQWQRSQQPKAAIRKRFQVPSYFKHGMPDEARCRHITGQEQVCNSKYAGSSPAQKDRTKSGKNMLRQVCQNMQKKAFCKEFGAGTK